MLYDCVVRKFRLKLLPKRLVTHEPAQLNVLSILVKCQEPNFCLSVGETVADKTNELQVVKVDYLLLLLLIGQVDHDKLPVVQSKSFVD